MHFKYGQSACYAFSDLGFPLTQTPHQNCFLFQSLYSKIKILDEIKFDQEILTKLLRRMDQVNINLLRDSDYQTRTRVFA